MRRNAATIVVTIFAVAAAALAMAAPLAAADPPPCQPGSGKKLAGKTLTAADVSRDMKCADLRGAKLAGLRMVQTDFSGALLDDADLTAASLIQTKFVGASARNANLRSAIMIQTTLTGADFSGAQLSGANLTQATLTGTNLTDANLSGANLTQARGTNVNLTRTNLSGASRIQASIEAGAGAAPPAVPSLNQQESVAATETANAVFADPDDDALSWPVSGRLALLAGGAVAMLLVIALAIGLLAGRGHPQRKAKEHSGIEIADPHSGTGRPPERSPYEAPPL